MTDISIQITKLKDLITKSHRVLITSHVSPDPDSICSILLLGTTLKTNYPDKIITMFSEEPADSLSYLHGAKDIESGSLMNYVVDNQPDLIIIVDAMNFVRCSRNDAEKISQHVKDKNIPLVIIDHHEPVGVEQNEIYINDVYPAAVQQVYETCFIELQLRKPQGFDETTMTGLYSDTGGFAFLNDQYQKTLELVKELLDAGVRIEKIKNKLQTYTQKQMKVLAELASNVSHEDDYNYTYLSDAFVDKWINDDNNLQELFNATKIFQDSFIRNIGGRTWGFMVYKNVQLGDNCYSVSLRSVGGTPDVSSIATKMDGGGHKGASGARVKAANVEEAIKKVQAAI
jgi:phosphoesterase RecJ-like protein